MKEKVLPNFKMQSLQPVIVQAAETNEVLMLGFTNEEAFVKSVNSGYAHFYSRTRKKIWMKGETSGNVQKIKDILIDCDNDSILFKVEQRGGACHTGYHSCFYRSYSGETVSEKVFDPAKVYDEKKVLDDLFEIIEKRKQTLPAGSYVASLMRDTDTKTSLNKICEKVGEEALETILAAKDGVKSDIVYESSDLIFHLFVLLSRLDISPYEIYKELKGRYKG